jgi:hypothetical protein
LGWKLLSVTELVRMANQNVMERLLIDVADRFAPVPVNAPDPVPAPQAENVTAYRNVNQFLESQCDADENEYLATWTAYATSLKDQGITLLCFKEFPKTIFKVF